jgi:hypothetical protein
MSPSLSRMPRNCPSNVLTNCMSLSTNGEIAAAVRASLWYSVRRMALSRVVRCDGVLCRRHASLLKGAARKLALASLGYLAVQS